jgi:hypothetical protein
MNIIIVVGRSRIIGNIYEPIIKPIKGYFNDKNITYRTIEFADQVRKDENNDNLYIGIFNHVQLIDMPKNYIMYVIEPLDNFNESMFIQVKNANKILVYLRHMLTLHSNSIFFPFPYHSSLENMYNIDKNRISKIYDLIIIGSLNDKRIKTYNRLKSNNYNIYCPNIEDHQRGIFEREHDKLLYSSKIVLLQNYFNNDIDHPRMTYNISNKIFFIYILNEDDDDDETLLDNIYDNMIVRCNSKNMFEVIDYYLNNEDKRIEKVNILYNYVKNNLNCYSCLDI